MKKVREIATRTALHVQASKGRLASGVFHDLMNPFQALLLALETLAMNSHYDNKQVNSTLTTALSECRRAHSLLCAIEKQDTGLSLPEDFLVHTVIKEAKMLIGGVARRKNVNIVHRPRSHITLHGNALLYRQVVLDVLEKVIAYATPSILSITAGIKKKTVVLTFEYHGQRVSFADSLTSHILLEEFHGTISSSKKDASVHIVEIIVPV